MSGNADQWRYRCPRGHTSWLYRASLDVFYCKQCQTHYDELVDHKHSTTIATPQRID